MSANSSTKTGLSTRIFQAFGLVLWVFSVFLFVQILVSLCIGILKGFGLNLGVVDKAAFVFSISVIIYALVLLITIKVPAKFNLWPSETDLKKLLGINLPLRVRDVGIAVLGFVVYFVLTFWVMQLVNLLFPSVNLNQVQNVGIKTLANNFEFVLAFITFVGLAPFAEELLFRGYLFGNLRRILSFEAAALITSALFGLVHFQWNVSIDVFVLSMVLCYLREYTNRLWPSIMVHMGKNLLAFAALFIFHLT